jgi:hypothetical protein
MTILMHAIVEDNSDKVRMQYSYIAQQIGLQFYGGKRNNV